MTLIPPLETIQCLCGCFIAHHHNNTQAPCTYCRCRVFTPDPLGIVIAS